MRNGLSYSDAGKLGAEKTKQIITEKKNKLIQNYNDNCNKCKNCLKCISYSKRNNLFCSSSCSAIYNNQKREKKQKTPCIFCGNFIKDKAKKYCSFTCQHKYQYKKNIEDWLMGNKKIGIVLYKKYLKEKFGEMCSMCKINEWMNAPIVLEVDHIDGNSNNNQLNNLRLLCPNCHSQTPTFKNKNKGNGRKNRK